MTNCQQSQKSSDNTCEGFCPYCGCACLLSFVPDSQARSVAKTLPVPGDPVSEGRPCIKGLMAHEMMNSNRLTTPMMRRSKDARLEECSWDDAFGFIKSKLDDMCEGDDYRNLCDKVYFLGSGEGTNESNYLLSKLSRSVFGSNNIDCCARLCHAATSVAFDRIFGIKAIPWHGIDDVKDADTFLFVGTDPFEDYPVLANRILEAKSKGAKLITIDVARSGTTEQSDIFFKIAPNGIIPMLAHLVTLLTKGRDGSKRSRNIDGYSDFVTSMTLIANQKPVSVSGLTLDEMKHLYQMIDDAKKLVIGFGMGLTQHDNGTQNVLAITGLALLTGAVLFPNRGKVNVQGAWDMGTDPTWRPLLPKGFDRWDRSFMGHKGVRSTVGLYDDDVKFVWVMGSNPSQSMPDLNALDESLRRKFVLFQHHHPGRTMEFADVVLPGAVVCEESGSVTSGERRVRGVLSYLSLGSGCVMGWLSREVRSNSDIITAFARYLGVEGFDFRSEADIWEDIVRVVPGYGELDFGKVFAMGGQFADKNPVWTKLHPVRYERGHFEGKGDYPFVLTTARSKFHFCTGEGTRNSRTLSEMAGEPEALLNPRDAEVLGIGKGGEVKVTSTVGEIVVRAKADIGVAKRVIVMPYHYDTLLINRLTPRLLDDESGTPCYKQIHVKIVKV